jgi:UMF1 family MFS transporter
LIALWAVVFAWPLFLFVRDNKIDKTDTPTRARITDSFRQLLSTIRKLPAQPDLLWLLIASALYRDGLNTLFAVGGQYAAGTFGMGFEEILIFAIGMNIASGAGSIAFGFLDDRIGSKRTIILALLGILLTGAALTLLSVKAWFMPVALVLGLFIGPAQSSARALVARLAPPELTTEIFGLYQFAGKSVAFLGPFAFAAAVSATHSQRWGLATILAFIAAGLGFMLKVKDQFNTKAL